MFNFTHAPLPTWKNIFEIFFQNCKSDIELAKPWVKNSESSFWFSRSSWSLYAIAKFRMKMKGKKNITIWFPGYFCNAAITPLRFLNVNISFYPLSDDYSPDLKACNEMLVQECPDLVVGVHYFGKSTNLFELFEFTKKTNSWLIEDCAHCLKEDQGVGNLGDFLIFSQHKFLPIPDAALLIIRHNGPGNITKQILEKYYFNEIYKFIINEKKHLFQISSLKWLLKRTLQIIGFRSVKRKIKFHEDEIMPEKKLLIHPKMSYLSKKLLSIYCNKLDHEISIRKKNQLGWCQKLIDKYTSNQKIKMPADNYTPYLALFIAKDSNTAEEIFDYFQKINIPISSWPDLPPEVLSNKSKHKVSILARSRNVLLPVHRSINL